MKPCNFVSLRTDFCIVCLRFIAFKLLKESTMESTFIMIYYFMKEYRKKGGRDDELIDL